jgi:hypothetical protein
MMALRLSSKPILEKMYLITREERMAFSILIKDISRVTLSLNDQAIQLINNSYSTILDLKTGENNFIVIRAMDEAGNVSTLYKKDYISNLNLPCS